jgi:tRNA (guanosine-2'-O-)-methyltransferase
MKNLSSTDLKRLHRDWRRRTGGRVALLLDGVQGPFNLGSILRTAAAYRVEHLWLAGTDTIPTSEKVGKTALGSDRYVEWTACATAQDAVGAARSAGFEIVGVELAEGAEPIHEARLGDAVCLALGHEDRGLSQACLDECDRVVYLPQLGRIGSLNVATAAALAIWEVRRRHWEDAAR